MISELFMGVLSCLGKPTKVLTICKNTRDEVLWEQSLNPWRRSPMWLLIRVSLQLVISRCSGGSHSLYKEIMVYIMSHILKKSIGTHDLPADIVYTMTAKIHRRLQKLSVTGPPVLPDPVMASINCVLQQASVSVSQLWNFSQKQDSRDLQLPALSTLDLKQDTLVAISALDAYIKALRTRQHYSSSASFLPSSYLLKFEPGVLPSLLSNKFNDPVYAPANLNQFEQWVSQPIDNWVALNSIQDDACGKLHDLIRQYHTLAIIFYSGNPEATSVMVLTIFELWVACDKAALQKCPWLSEYDPGIPTTVLQSLLLPFLHQMKRLSTLEEYLNGRRSRSSKQTDLLFDLNNGQSFASQYFDKSELHRALLSKIDTDAKAARQAKLEEFKNVKDKYMRLDARYKETIHKYTTRVIDAWCNPPETEQVHRPNDCSKCSLGSQHNALSITVHEWPLPSNSSREKAVVFELHVPEWFAHWRNARLVLLQDILQGEREQVRPLTRYLLSSGDPHATLFSKNDASLPYRPLVPNKACTQHALQRQNHHDAQGLSNMRSKRFELPVLRRDPRCISGKIQVQGRRSKGVYVCDAVPSSAAFSLPPSLSA